MTNNLAQIQMFEKRSYWKIERYSGLETERIRFTVSWIPSDTLSILDVGCGNGILVNNYFPNSKVVGIDQSFAALNNVKRNPCQSIVIKLPFANQSFDIGVCTEVLEHLPINVFDESLSEISRVSSKYILITVPNNENLKNAYIECPICCCHFHPHFHMQSFNRDRLTSMFSDRNLPFKILKMESIFPFWNMKGVGYIRKLLRISQDYPSHAICPQCGYFINQTSFTGDRNVARVNMKIKEAVKKIWPFRKKEFRWFIALYSREGI